MLKKKAIRKIIITTSSLFILLMVYLIPSTPKEEVTPASLEIEYLSGLGNNNIYLLNENNFLVKNSIILTGESLKNKIKNILEELTNCECNFLPDGLFATIPKDTKINNIKIDNKHVTIDFSKEILNQNNYLVDKMIESIVFSILDLKELDSISLQIDGTPLTKIKNTEIDEVLTKNIGINKTYEIRNRENIDHITIYYIDEIQSRKHYVPVTKYLNLSKEKVEVIIESLANEYIYESNLISRLNQNTKLLNYSIEGYTMILNFNKDILNQSGKIDEEVENSIYYSIFDNYDINQVILQVEGKQISKKILKDID